MTIIQLKIAAISQIHHNYKKKLGLTTTEMVSKVRLQCLQFVDSSENVVGYGLILPMGSVFIIGGPGEWGLHSNRERALRSFGADVTVTELSATNARQIVATFGQEGRIASESAESLARILGVSIGAQDFISRAVKRR